MNDWTDRRILLIGGPGGVGKTTVAAALGVRLAERGHRTVVLTVDPARRLAQALGLEGIHSELQDVALETGTGSLKASMLDTERYFDRLIGRFARSPEQRDRILNHRLYRTATASMGGTHEYAAMERLLEFAKDPSFDRIVVDTPPTQNAVDLLSAPQRMADFMNASILEWFRGGQRPKYLQFFQKGTRLAMKLLERIFGSDFLTTFGEFMEELHGMHEGFRARNLEVMELLRSREAAFLLVTYPSEVRAAESESFRETLRETGIGLAGLVLNRVEPEFPRRLPPGTQVPPEAHARLDALLDYYGELRQAQNPWIDRLRTSLAGTPCYLIPRRANPPHDIRSLSAVGGLLVS